MFQATGFRYFTESNKNGFEMLCGREFSPFRIPASTWSDPCEILTEHLAKSANIGLLGITVYVSRLICGLAGSPL